VEPNPAPSDVRIEPSEKGATEDDATTAAGSVPKTPVDVHVATPSKPVGGEQSPAPGELASPLQRTRSVKKLKKRVPAVKTIMRPSGVGSALISKMLCEHFAGRCQHRFEPASAELEQGIW
jgi:hypothetical protein